LALRLFLGGELAYERPSSIEIGSAKRFRATAAESFEQEAFEIALTLTILIVANQVARPRPK